MPGAFFAVPWFAGTCRRYHAPFYKPEPETQAVPQFIFLMGRMPVPDAVFLNKV